MKQLTAFLLGYILFLLPAHGQAPEASIYIDKKGIMRWSDSKQEASFYGVNYTLPFAHAYRAIGYTGLDHREAIDKDVYHFARLGFNAYRIHIWDVEISDAQGNLQENEHLDLLDYLIFQLRERGIRTVITAMTNFGNGYPEKNLPTGGFSYLYTKCEIHDRPEAIRAQENYITQLIRHKNPYTEKAYKDDPAIVGFEINNEPCHALSPESTRRYIQTMLSAIRKTGNRKPVFYNVSHNESHVESYYQPGIQGTTYQWYPMGLVAGQTREGNFLPYVDQYPISFSQKVKDFDKKAKLVYEYDPADNNYSYLHPAMVRTFRSAGFQWITQFAYDPIDIARYNTEYQTHFLNLAYTPQKALSLKIAAEAARSIPLHKQYPRFPNDTVFEGIRVSYDQDLSELNRPEKFFYTNHTDTKPVAPERLESIAGYGHSPIVRYEGRGAYFLDKLEEGLWRLEVMPDAVAVDDPFKKTSLKKEVVSILWNNWPMWLSIPSLSDAFTVHALRSQGQQEYEVNGGHIPSLSPGVYLLKRKGYVPEKNWETDTPWGTIRLGEYVAPQAHAASYRVVHKPASISERNRQMTISAEICGPHFPDSVIVYTDRISFWKEHNPYYKMERVSGYTYRTSLPAEELTSSTLRYHIVVCRDGKQYTFPEGKEGGPLDWDFLPGEYWETELTAAENPVVLISASGQTPSWSTYAIPESYQVRREKTQENPVEAPLHRFSFESKETSPRFYLQAYIRERLRYRSERTARSSRVGMILKSSGKNLRLAFVTRQGFTYAASLPATKQDIVYLPVTAFSLAPTTLLPHPYPVFLPRYFHPDTSAPFRLEDIEKVEISAEGETGKPCRIEAGSIWLE